MKITFNPQQPGARVLWLALTLTLLTPACKPSAPPSAGADTHDDTAGALGDAAGSDTQKAQDTKTSVDGALDVAGDAATDTAMDTTTDGAAADVPADTTPPPPGLACPATASVALAPGAPCKVKGEMRCSDAGRYTSPKNALFGNKPQPFCIRPNVVRCELIEGQLRWKLAGCPKPAGPADCPVAKLPLTCSEVGGVASCCPLACMQDKKSLPYVSGAPDEPLVPPPAYAFRCDPKTAGGDSCAYNTRLRYTCTTPGGTPAVKAYNKNFFHACSQWCAGCTYWFVYEACPQIKCKKSKDEKPPCTMDNWTPECEEHHGNQGKFEWHGYTSHCIEQADGNGPCQKTCEEMGLFTP